jgi:hypothetical protein
MKFRRLEIELPKQPVVNQKAFAVGGWVLVIAVFLITVLAYKYR